MSAALTVADVTLTGGSTAAIALFDVWRDRQPSRMRPGSLRLGYVTSGKLYQNNAGIVGLLMDGTDVINGENTYVLTPFEEVPAAKVSTDYPARVGHHSVRLLTRGIASFRFASRGLTCRRGRRWSGAWGQRCRRT